MLTMREFYGNRLTELGERDSRIVVLDADVSSSTRTAIFKQRFPDRFFNFGIAEANMVAAAAGFAANGCIPFVNTFAFLLTLRCTDQIRSLIAYNQLNVKIVGGYGGLSDSYDGASHQSIEDIGVISSIPNIVVLVPTDNTMLSSMLEEACNYNGPVYIRLNRNHVSDIYESCEFKIGKGFILREGNDVTIVSNGIMTAKALEAARILYQMGISSEVIDMPCVKPIDNEILVASASKTGRVIVAEEHNVFGGLTSAVSMVLSMQFPCKVKSVAIQDCFAQSGGYEELLEHYDLTSAAIVEKALEFNLEG